MAQFINSREDIVQEAIDGVLAASGGALSRLDGYPFIRVVVRSDWDKSRVAVISGGGSGHEPAHAGFVGSGMLTAAVCGDVFASPSVDAVLAGILAVTGPAGCLLIVKNYTGDRLNFGLAAERARASGLKVNMVIVQDDIAIPGLSRPRGVAGTLLVHKIAGAVSERGGDLGAVTRAAQRVADSAISFGMSLDTCTVPGSAKEDRIPPGEVELGLGIHGEPGVQTIPFEGVRQVISRIVPEFAKRLRPGRHVALLNNLGSTTGLEMSIVAEELRQSSIGGAISHIIGPAAMMTALDMHGFSLTLYPLGAEDADLLSAETKVRAWPGMQPFSAARVIPLPSGLEQASHPASANPAHRAMLARVCDALIAAEADLNLLDAKSGDGDTGSTLAGAARALMARIDQLPLADLAQLHRAIGQDLSQTMGGSSGVLLAILFTATGDALSKGLGLTSALRAGLDRLQEVGGAKPGDRTMIDALHPALDALPRGLADAAAAARAGADLTASLSRAQAGRATYISAGQLQGHVDPGAEAVARLFECLRDARPA
jgi:dihydroxyacetone kinase